jgi:pimeloyl-ACP methyl ester carboxylesterase
MRRISSLGALLALVAGLLAGGTAPVSAAPAKKPPPVSAAPLSTIVWGACADEDLAAFGAQCGSLGVPLDHDDPSAGVVTLALSRVRHTVPDAQYQGVMLVNPGGPGGPGLTLSVLGECCVPHGAGAAYDWIGFDPRGVGASTPRLSCIPGYFGYARPDYVPTDPADEQAWLARVRAYAAACAANNGPLLEHMRTVDVARDVEAIRIALGQQRLSWYGFSYGTYIGQVYATLYPQRVHRMVLDGVVDPSRVWHQANLDQDYAFDEAFDAFFAWIASHDAVYGLGSTGAAVREAYFDARAALHGNPALGLLGPSEFDDALLGAGYAQFLWPVLAQALSDLVVRGDATGLLAQYPEPGDDNGYAVYVATQCTDAKWPTRWKKWQKETARVYEDAQIITWGNAWFNAPCAFWPVPPSKPLRVSDKGAPPILLISETLDAATPYSGALAVRRIFRDSVLVAVEGGTTHAGSLGGNACVDDVIATYLATGALPARRPGGTADVVCAAPPLPLPETADPAAATAGTARVAVRRG